MQTLFTPVVPEMNTFTDEAGNVTNINTATTNTPASSEIIESKTLLASAAPTDPRAANAATLLPTPAALGTKLPDAPAYFSPLPMFR